MGCFSPLKGYKSRSSGGIVFKRSGDAYEPMEVACSQCLGCRLDRSKQWAIRIVHEASLYEENCFITLTYRPEESCTDKQKEKGYYMPKDGSLNKRHFQKFMKKLRIKNKEKKIRFFHCGEYGEKLERPHYHACLFNHDFPDRELYKNNNGNHLYTSKELEKIWPYGFSTIGELTLESAAYCARYITKKITGDRADTHYMRHDDYGVSYWLEPEYTTMSRRPGLAKEWYESYKTDVFPADEVPVPGKGVIKGVPRYYEELLKREAPLEHEKIKQTRQEFFNAHAEEYSHERLWTKYKVTKAKMKQLERSYEDGD